MVLLNHFSLTVDKLPALLLYFCFCDSDLAGNNSVLMAVFTMSSFLKEKHLSCKSRKLGECKGTVLVMMPGQAWASEANDY